MKPAICTQCGAQIEVDETKEAGICKNCGTAFITEKVINNYITQNTTVNNTVHNVTENVTKIILGDEKDEGNDHFKRGVTHLKLKRYGDAIGEFEKATEKSPECAKYWFYLFYAQTKGFSEVDPVWKESLISFLALATEEEKHEYEKEFSVSLKSLKDFYIPFIIKYGENIKNLNDAKALSQMISGVNVDFTETPDLADKYLNFIFDLNLNPVAMGEFCNMTPVLIAAYNVTEKKEEYAEKYFPLVNRLNKYNSLIVADNREYLKNGVFEYNGNRNFSGGFFLMNFDGIEKLIVKDNKSFFKHYTMNKTARIPVVEIDSSCNCNNEHFIGSIIKLAEELLILPENITSLTKYNHITQKSDIQIRNWDRNERFPADGCLLYFKGDFTGGLAHSYYTEVNGAEGKTVEVKVDRWPCIAGGKIYNSSPDNELLIKYFGKDHGFVPAEEKEPQSKKQGCYVATCVYGSYDCPEVWTLRRYRDFSLKNSAFGRAFIKVYYAISPKVVKTFGKYKWFNKLFKGVLDKKVNKLNEKGFEDTPYNDNN